eukprot:775653-Amphidinium_carterae.1
MAPITENQWKLVSAPIKGPKCKHDQYITTHKTDMAKVMIDDLANLQTKQHRATGTLPTKVGNGASNKKTRFRNEPKRLELLWLFRQRGTVVIQRLQMAR